MEDEDSTLVTASSPTENEIAITRAQDEIEWRTRQVAANMLRIMAGAGRPFDLFDQMRRLHEAIGSVPPDALVGHVTDAMLAALISEDDGFTDYFERPIDTIERGALRKAASRIMGQATQMTAGNSLIWEGVRAIESRREEKRREREASLPKVSPVRRPSVRKPKAAAVSKPNPQQTGMPAPQESAPRTTADFMKLNRRRCLEGKKPL